MSSEIEENDFGPVVPESKFDNAEERRRRELENEGQDVLEHTPKKAPFFRRIIDMVARREDVNHEGVHWSYDEDPNEHIRQKVEERWKKKEDKRQNSNEVLVKKYSHEKDYRDKARRHLADKINRKIISGDVYKEDGVEKKKDKATYGNRFFHKK